MTGKPGVVSPEDSLHRVHTYYKGSPYHPDGRRILCARFESIREGGQVCLIDRETGNEQVLGNSSCVTYHNGAGQYFCDGGRKVIYQEAKNVVSCSDIITGQKKSFEGEICIYSGNIDKKFIQIDYGYPPEEQGSMGIYIRNIDGTDRKVLATVDDLLEAHPHGSSIRNSGVLLRLGGEISPDREKAALFLITREGLLIRDYYLCGIDGSNLVFHGRLGGHIMWHPNSRNILAFVAPHKCSFFGHLRGGNPKWGYGLLASYDTKTREMKILSDYKIRGGCHVSPSPPGGKIVLDCIQRDSISILLFEEAEGEMVVLCTLARTFPKEKVSGLSNPKHYDMNPHPVFSPDGKRIIFNSCTDGTVRLYEIDA